MKPTPISLRIAWALLLANSVWLCACTAVEPTGSTPFRCDRNGTQEERAACH